MLLALLSGFLLSTTILFLVLWLRERHIRTKTENRSVDDRLEAKVERIKAIVQNPNKEEALKKLSEIIKKGLFIGISVALLSNAATAKDDNKEFGNPVVKPVIPGDVVDDYGLFYNTAAAALHAKQIEELKILKDENRRLRDEVRECKSEQWYKWAFWTATAMLVVTTGAAVSLVVITLQ